jgi:mRNA-degrading endonuclease RelE of RelBE toxin-antitoxin system
MKITIEKKVSKELKKLPPHIQKKFKQLLNELVSTNRASDVNPKWEIKKMDYNNSVYRCKLDPWYRVLITKCSDCYEVSKVGTRESVIYIGCK